MVVLVVCCCARADQPAVVAIVGMSNMQELDDVKKQLAAHETRLEKVRAKLVEEEATGNKDRVKELEQTERDLLAVIKEVLIDKNRLSNQLGE